MGPGALSLRFFRFEYKECQLSGDLCDTVLSGAGKTTTFNMLTGDLSITEGTAFIDGYDIQTHLRKVRIYMDLLLKHFNWKCSKSYYKCNV